MNKQNSKSIRPFIGAESFTESKEFYTALGFKVINLGSKMSFIQISENNGFYLQDYYVKDWVENTMLFWEVGNTEETYNQIVALNLSDRFDKVKVSPINNEDWGREFFLHDPSGVLWHIGSFKA